MVLAHLGSRFVHSIIAGHAGADVADCAEVPAVADKPRGDRFSAVVQNSSQNLLLTFASYDSDAVDADFDAG